MQQKYKPLLYIQRVPAVEGIVKIDGVAKAGLGIVKDVVGLEIVVDEAVGFAGARERGELFGEAIAGGGEGGTKKTLRGALGFVLGFTIVFVALGALAGTLGSFLSRHRTAVDTAQKAGLFHSQQVSAHRFHGDSKLLRQIRHRDCAPGFQKLMNTFLSL